jgi:hypothetical protein
MREEMKRQIVDGELMPTNGSTAKTLGPRFLSSRSGNRDTYNDENRWHNHVATAAWARLEPKAVTRHDGEAWLKALKARHAPKKPHNDPKRRGGAKVERIGVSTRRHCLVLARRFFEWAIKQPQLGITSNPFAGLTIEREDGDEEQGYQDT